MDNMKSAAVWLILISYLLMGCGDMLEAGCCQKEAAHVAGEHTAHEHTHSKVQVVVHGLLHWPVPEDIQRVVPRHCCCVKQGEQDPGLPCHSLTAQFRTLKPSDVPTAAIAPQGLGRLATGLSVRSHPSLDSLGSTFVLQSIHATILLI